MAKHEDRASDAEVPFDAEGWTARLVFVSKLPKNCLRCLFIKALFGQVTQHGIADLCQQFVENAHLGPLHGGIVLAVVGMFYASLLIAVVCREPDDGEFAHGEVHV